MIEAARLKKISNGACRQAAAWIPVGGRSLGACGDWRTYQPRGIQGRGAEAAERTREAKVLGRRHRHTSTEEAENAKGSQCESRYEGGQAEATDVAGARAFGHPRIK
jgi:hypothetical protein